MRSALRRAHELARMSAVPDIRETEQHTTTLPLTLLFRALRRLVRRCVDDNLPQRAAALSFFTLLSAVPLIALTFALLKRVSGLEGTQSFVAYVARRYFPSATEDAIGYVAPLLTGIDLDAIGVIGLAALLPLTISMVREIDRALIEVFRAPEKHPAWRLLLQSGLVIAVPAGTLLGAHWAPRFESSEIIDRHLWPFLVAVVFLFLVFKYLPAAGLRKTHALIGAATSALLLEVGKALFSIYATYLARGLHIVWGAIAFVPMLLVWIFLAWAFVLFGAEVAAVVHELSISVDANDRKARRVRVPRLRQRLRRRLGLRPRVRASEAFASIVTKPPRT
ncbi:MAG: YihY/virulence factor BrkB family protein [Sandaracinaceae bacterium]|nr:YihY/virulence factor BrkB family protein [Sandaracinaceae bacterium]